MYEAEEEPDERPEEHSEALEEAEKARIHLEAEAIARKLAEGEAIRRLPGASQVFA